MALPLWVQNAKINLPEQIANYRKFMENSIGHNQKMVMFNSGEALKNMSRGKYRQAKLDFEAAAGYANAIEIALSDLELLDQ